MGIVKIDIQIIYATIYDSKLYLYQKDKLFFHYKIIMRFAMMAKRFINGESLSFL